MPSRDLSEFRSCFIRGFCVVLCTISVGSVLNAGQPVLLDTDIGDAVDDAFALALVLASPELELRGVTTVGPDAHTKAGIVCQFLENVGQRAMPVAAGGSRQPQPELKGQHQYGLRARQTHPLNKPAVELLRDAIEKQPGELTILAIGPLTNIAALVKQHPETARKIKRLVILGGAVRVGYSARPPAEPEWNVRTDVAAARAVLASGLPIMLVPLDASAELRLEGKRLERLLASPAPLARQAQALYELADVRAPVLFDPAAVAMAVDESLFVLEPLRLEIDDNGLTRAVEGQPNARVALSVNREALLDWCVARLTTTAGESSGTPQKREPPVIVRPVARGGLPARVHVFEDYETEIERRWWLAGKLETQNVPPGSRRACRGVLCRDFDDKLGLRGATYRAVIFNPVPGPPMGPNTRLSFRYWLKGTDSLRVQIYSLSNGYHRQLVLTDALQGQWGEATVDMTAARRPDGSGGALAADERIDDIQFYVAPQAELVIDDIVLYDAAAPSETVPFPKRFLFTGWFDTGRQGMEWPGDFEVVPHEPPLKWKAAQAVETPDKEARWIRVDLRGQRPLGERATLRFRYRLSGADSIEIELGRAVRKLAALRQNEWSNAAIDYSPGFRTVDQLVFRVPRAAQLQVDDVLLFEPRVPGE
jgi:inosine-uridine nucleoside N-ribohydrolase